MDAPARNQVAIEAIRREASVCRVNMAVFQRYKDAYLRSRNGNNMGAVDETRNQVPNEASVCRGNVAVFRRYMDAYLRIRDENMGAVDHQSVCIV